MLTDLSNDELEKILDLSTARDASNLLYALKSTKCVKINYNFHSFMQKRRDLSITDIMEEAIKNEKHDIVVHILSDFKYTSYCFKSKVASLLMEYNKFQSIEEIEKAAKRLKGKNTFLKTDFLKIVDNILCGLSSSTIKAERCALNNVSFETFKNFETKTFNITNEILVFFNNVFCHKIRKNQNCINDVVQFLTYCCYKKHKATLMFSALNLIACSLMHEENNTTLNEILNVFNRDNNDADLQPFHIHKDNDQLPCILLPHISFEMYEYMHRIYLHNICLANSTKEEDFMMYTNKIIQIYYKFNSILDNKIPKFLNTSSSFDDRAKDTKVTALKYCFMFGGNHNDFSDVNIYNTHWYGRSLKTPIANALLLHILKNGETKWSRQLILEIGHKSTLHAPFFNFISTGRRKSLIFILNALCFNQSTNAEAANYVVDVLKQNTTFSKHLIDTILNTGNIKIIETLKYASKNINNYVHDATIENIAKNGPDADAIFEKAIVENPNDNTNFFFKLPFPKCLHIFMNYKKKLPKTFQKIKSMKLWTTNQTNTSNSFEFNIALTLYKNNKPLSKLAFVEEIFKYCKLQSRSGFIESIKQGAFNNFGEQIFSIYQRLDQTFQFDIIKIIQRQLTC